MIVYVANCRELWWPKTQKVTLPKTLLPDFPRSRNEKTSCRPRHDPLRLDLTTLRFVVHSHSRAPQPQLTFVSGPAGRQTTRAQPRARRRITGTPNVNRGTVGRIVMACLTTATCVVRPGLARGGCSARAPRTPTSCAMSGLVGSAPVFLGKPPSALSAGLVPPGGAARGAGTRSVATAGLFGLGLPELVVIGGVAAVLFGPSKLPELGKSLGKTVKSFQAAATEFSDELKEGREAAEEAEAAEPKQIEDGEDKKTE